MKDLRLGPPGTPDEWAAYYHLRWSVLRAPWGQPEGSEKDELETDAWHVVAVAPDGAVVGGGRLHHTPEDGEGQIRYMSVRPDYQGQRVGNAILSELERLGREAGLRRLVLNARESAVSFYEKHGYVVVGQSAPLFGVIPHLRMRKTLA